MLTLTLLIIVWGIISAFRVNRSCKKQGIAFDPLEAPVLDYLGLCISTLYVVAATVHICIKYLP
jgi:hypothetical protein